MIQSLLLSVLLVAPAVVEAVAPYNWTWWGGSNVNTGVIWPSAKGLFQGSSQVGSRFQSSLFVDDQTNSAYVFGGFTYVGTGYMHSRTNDMWKCDFSRDASSAWTWIHGSNTFNNPGVYTAIGDTSDYVYPGSRDDFMNFYDTEMRKFFLFGGKGYSNSTKRGYLNDRWSYDVDTNRFTWIGGSLEINTDASTPTLIESENITFGGLFAAAFAYDKNSKLFYIFGGENAVGFSNALWRYRVSSNTFTLLKIHLTASVSNIIKFGALDSRNSPGFRQSASLVISGDGNLFLAGGYGLHPLKDYSDTVNSASAETWMFNLTANMWALVAGSPFAIDQGNYTQDSAFAYPSSRYAPNWLLDSGHDQILFQGGEFVDINDQFSQCSDEWLFNMKNYTWRLVINEACTYNPQEYGTYRVTSSQNRPGWRSASAHFLIENGAYLFSGNDNGDLWKLDFAKQDSVASSTETTSTSASTFTETSTTTTAMLTTTTEATTLTTSITTLIDSVASSTESTFTSASTFTEMSTTTMAILTTTSEATTITTPITTLIDSVTTLIPTAETDIYWSSTELPSTLLLTWTSTNSITTQANESIYTTSWLNISSILIKENRTSTRSLITRSINPSGVPLTPEKSETFLDPTTVIYVAIGAVCICLVLLLCIGAYFYRKLWRKKDFSKYKLTVQLPSRTQSYSVTAVRTVSSLPGGDTLFTTSQDVLSVPAYLELSESSFRITSKLSHGGGGEVYLADALDERTRVFGSVLAVKRIQAQAKSQKLTERQMKLFEQELSVMAMLRNYKNIAKIVGYCRSESYSIIMKYYRMGPLDKFIQNGKNVITKNLVTNFVLDIASGIRALHQNDLSHSDIKTANVLIDMDKEGFAYCVLTDFGITQILSLNLVVNGFNVANIKGLSYPYASPETFTRLRAKSILSDSPDTFKAGDVYAWGSILYELMSRQVPWSGND